MRANVGRERPVGRFVRGMQAQKTPSADRTRRGADKIELTADAGILPAVNGLGADLPGQIGHQAAVDRDKPRLLRGTERIVEHVHRDHADVRERKIIQMPRRVEHDGRLDPIEIDRAAGHQAQLRLCEHLRVNPEPFASMQPVGDGVGNAADADLQRIAVPDERQDVRGNARIECIGRFIMIGIERMIRAAERRNLRDMDAMVLAAGALLKGVDLIDALFDLCIVKMIREFAERELDPVVKEYDEKGEFPVQLHEKWGEMGLFGLDVPEQYGGLGLNAVTRYCISEELAKHDAGFTISNNSYSFGLSAILADGTEAQKQAACARILRGEGISMAITEPQSGSDVGSTRTSAKKVDGGYVLNGVKCFITNATLCSACVVLAVTNPDAGYHGMSLLLVEKSDAGVSVGKHEDKLGIRLSDTADFVMEDVFVPADRLIGTEGNGFAQTMKFLAGKRPVSVAGAVGVAQRALDLAVDYARERSFKHGPIAKLEGIQFLIADMEMRIQASRAMAVYGAQMTDAGIPIGTLGNSLKCFASEMCYDVVNMGLQVFAGYGYSREYPLEKLLRDARIYSIFEGTNQVQRQVIGKTLLG